MPAAHTSATARPDSPSFRIATIWLPLNLLFLIACSSSSSRPHSPNSGVYRQGGLRTEAAPQHLCLDKGYDYEVVRKLVADFGFDAHIRSRGEDRAAAIERQAGQRARRRVVERTHSWTNRFRRLLVRWEKRADTYIAMLHFACGLITWRAAGLPG